MVSDFCVNMTLVGDTHTTYDNDIVTAPQIIAHTNDALRWFVTPKEASEIAFTQ